MRWYWIDRFIEFESGQYAKAVKQVTLAEEHLHDHFPAYPLLPASLILEGLAQTAGLLIFEHGHFAGNPILAKIPSTRFHSEVRPGDTLTYTATIQYVQKEGALVHATSYAGQQLQAEAEIVFACFDGEHRKGMLFDPAVFRNMMRLLGAFEVGRTADGQPLVDEPAPAEPVAVAAGNGKAPSLVGLEHSRPLEGARVVAR